jgi:hypothetical protein
MLKRPVVLTALCGGLISVWPVPLSAGPNPRMLPPSSPPPPPPAPPAALPMQDNGSMRARGTFEGRVLSIHGKRQQASWLWVGPASGGPLELWLPLEVLQGQLGFSSRTRGDGALELEWFGQSLIVPQNRQRSLADEVAMDVAPFLSPRTLLAQMDAGELRLQGGRPQVRQARVSAAPPGSRRVVLDLTGPAVVRSSDGGVWVAAEVPETLVQDLRRLGLTGRQEGEGWALLAPTAPQRVFTLGQPSRVVLDLAASRESGAGAGTAPAQPSLDPRLQALLGSQVFWSKDLRSFGGRRFRLNSVRMDPLGNSLELRNLSRGAGMEGLTTLPLLARRYDALVAINGGYFNRVRRLPLGALRDQGQWLSGPILNRGVVAWEGGSLPSFGRLNLQEWVGDGTARQWPVEFVNSGYVKRGLARYTPAWGPYRALSGSEQAVLLRGGVVQRRYDSAWLAAGVPLGPGEDLLVARSVPLPWDVGTRLQLASRPSSDLGLAPNVMGGGPLLLQGGRIVLDGLAEGFSPAFLRQGAPRTVIGSDGRFLWLLTLEGLDDEGPTLAETARFLQAAGLQDALNLDGGSSTGLVMGGLHTVKGRGVVSAVHNGLGLVPRSTLGSANTGATPVAPVPAAAAATEGVAPPGPAPVSAVVLPN